MSPEHEARALARRLLRARLTLAPADLLAASGELRALAARDDSPETTYLADVVGGLVDVGTGDADDVGGAVARLDDLRRAVPDPLLRDDDPTSALVTAWAALAVLHPEDVRGVLGHHLTRSDLDTETRAYLWCLVGVADAWAGDLLRGEVSLRQAFDLALSAETDDLAALSGMLLGKAESLRGNVDAAREHLARARELSASAGAHELAGGQIECALLLPLVEGDDVAYVAMLELLVAEPQGEMSGLAAEFRLELATARAVSGQPESARALAEDTRGTTRGTASTSLLNAWSRWVADIDSDEAMSALETEASRPHVSADRQLSARVLWLLGSHRARLGERGQAIRLLQSAARRFTRIGARGLTDRIDVELAALQAGAGPTPRNGATRPAGARAVRDGALTEAEERVARAVCSGLSNREVAALLFISERTVEAHLTSIFRKVGVHSRTELAIRL